jgi:transcriptional regulator with XRE-family HTH domain
MSSSLGELLRAFRASGKIQDEIVVELGVIDNSLNIDRSTVSRWEADKVPSRKRAAKIASALAKLLNLPVEEVNAAIAESRRRKQPHGDLVLGNYELFQWSYANDGRIMKTNISIERESSGRKYQFTEHVLLRGQNGIIRGTVVLVGQHLLFSGRGTPPFEECEAILIGIPRENEWTTGVVLGVTSDSNQYPSASGTVVHYLGHKKFDKLPLYISLKAAPIPEKFKKFLSEPFDSECPVISSRNASR